jgi:hypothetical protein
MPNYQQQTVPEIDIVPHSWPWDVYDTLFDEDSDDDDLLPSDVEYPDDEEESGDVIW